MSPEVACSGKYMNIIDIHDEDNKDTLPPGAVGADQVPTLSSGQDRLDEHERIARSKSKLTSKSFVENVPSTLVLTYQSLGLVYGDLSTSPLYVYSSAFSGKLQDHQNPDAVFGVFSLIFWTLTLIPLLKYVTIILSADDNGEGGTFALYSLLCRHKKLSPLPNQQAADEELSSYKYGPLGQFPFASPLKRYLEKHKKSRTALLLVVLLGAGMLIGEGIITPAMSVLSSVSALTAANTRWSEGRVILLACAILVGLFALQHCGTHKVGILFAPAVILWLISIFVIGLHNTIYWNPKIVFALSPHYIFKFFGQTGRDGWISLGGVLLCITGSEAMFADLGHFRACSIRLGFLFVVYPCLVVQYMGQAAYLSKNISSIPNAFYNSVPEAILWPVFIIATLAAIVASQAIISATFSTVKQCQALGCFPHVKIVHTSKQIYGQIYIPEINWILMILTLAVVIGFHDINQIGNAYGKSSCPVSDVLVFVCVKSVPVPYVPPEERFLIGRVCPRPYRMYRCIVRYGYKDSQGDDLDLENLLVQSIAEFIQMEAIEPRFLSPHSMSYDGRLAVISSKSFQSGSSVIVSEVEEFGTSNSIQTSKSSTLRSLRSAYEDENPQSRRRQIKFQVPENPRMDPSVREELIDLIRAKEAGVTYIMGHSYVKARRSSSFWKKLVIDFGYSFLRKNCRAVGLHVPQISLIEVGMIYHV